MFSPGSIAINDEAASSTRLIPDRAHPGTDTACRLLDLIVSVVALIVLSPVIAAIALAVKIDSPGPAIFRQRRLGLRLEPFSVNKFRTMSHGAADDIHRAFVIDLIVGAVPEGTPGGPRYKIRHDERVTRLGKILRRTSLDELPQLVNVLRGEMSLVGPRPPIPYEVDHYPPHWFKRFSVKPGVTGLWQVSGRSELTLAEMIVLDDRYVEARTLWLNLKILLLTLPVVISTRGAS